MTRLTSLLLLLGLALLPDVLRAEGGSNWPQFRGPDGSGLAVPEGARLPLHFGPGKNVLWQTPLPPGLSSPCIWGGRIFLTGYDPKTKELLTLCLDRRDGKVLWRRAAPARKIERVQATSSPATGTPASDGERVYVYFGSFGLLCYDFAGKELWRLPLPTPATRFGSGTSPVVAGEVVLLKCQGYPSSLLAVNGRTGAVVWKRERLPYDVGYSLPLVRRGKGSAEVVVHGERGVKAFDLAGGKDRWSLSGLFGAAIPTPIEADGLLFIVSQYPGGDQDDRLKVPPFDELLKKYDKDKDGQISREEAKGIILYSRDGETRGGDLKLSDFFSALDLNRDGKISRFEWSLARLMAGRIDNTLLAVRPDPAGKKPTVVWRDKKALPEVSSPLHYRGRLYLVKHLGIVSCLEAKTGKLLYRKRLGATGLYYASPVAGDGKVYFASTRGVVVVLDGSDATGKVLARNDLGESLAATPAPVDGVLYVRTDKHLFAFKE
jgi:outer membrane protein assembly factor BamB